MIRGLLEPTHLILILVIIMVVFGPGKLPNIGSNLGRGIRDFKKALSDSESATTLTSEGETTKAATK